MWLYYHKKHGNIVNLSSKLPKPLGSYHGRTPLGLNLGKNNLQACET